MKLTPTMKAIRVLRFLLGLRNPRSAAALHQCGMRAADADEGWNRLKALGGFAVDEPPDATSTSRAASGRATSSRAASGKRTPSRTSRPVDHGSALDELSAWKKHWFVVMRASLSHPFPDVLAGFLGNLAAMTGNQAPFAVVAFLARWQEPHRDAAKAARVSAAKQLLARRGLTDAVIERARALVDAVQKGAPAIPRASLHDAEADAMVLSRNQKALWAWYLEWSRLARLTIKDHLLLRQLGLTKIRSGSARGANAQASKRIASRT